MCSSDLMGEVLKKYGNTMEESAHLMVFSFERKALKIPSFIRKIMSKLSTNKKLLHKIFIKRERDNAANAAKNPGSFEMKTQIPPEEGYDFSFHIISCPLANFAKQYGYEEYMPYLCNLDYVMLGTIGMPLFREHTCFEDGDYCDFKIKAGEKQIGRAHV